MTKSWPSAAAFGVGAVLPPNFSAHALALAAERLYTVTSWPPLATRCPAMGKPMTPRPRKATLAIGAILGFCRRIGQPGMIVKGDDRLPRCSKQAPPYPRPGSVPKGSATRHLAGGRGFMIAWWNSRVSKQKRE